MSDTVCVPAEKAIAGLLAAHQHNLGVCTCGLGEEHYYGISKDNHRAHVASVIAAHMATPDELTALHQRMAELESSAANRFAMFQSAQNEITGLKAERDALRERIRALADEWESQEGLNTSYAYAAQELRAALGDS